MKTVRVITHKKIALYSTKFAAQVPLDGTTEREHSPTLDPTSQLPTESYNIDDIKVEFHPAVGIADCVYAFEDFNSRAPDVDPNPSDKPWVPFASRADFEFAELAHEAHLNKGQVSRLLSLIKKISSRQDTFTFHTSDDVDHAWEKAKLRYPSVCFNALM